MENSETSGSYSKEGHRQVVLKECVDRGLTLMKDLADVTPFRSQKLHLLCNTCGYEWTSSRLASFLNHKIRCKKCNDRRTGATRLKSDEVMVGSFFSSGQFPEGTKFWKSDRETLGGSKSFWFSTCIICSVDKYVQAGVCTGVFESFSGSLQVGNKPCRCSPSYKWTEDQRQLQIEERIREANLPYTFEKWTSVGKGIQSTFLLKCNKHFTTRSISVYNFLSNRSGCYECSGFGPNGKAADLYVLEVVDNTGSPVFTGYGITSNIDARMKTHRRNLSRIDYHIGDSFYSRSTGMIAKSVENLVKLRFKVCSQDVEGFKTEATYGEMYTCVVDFVKEQVHNLEHKSEKEVNYDN